MVNGRGYLAHFDAARYETMDDRREAERVASGIFKNARAAEDGMSVRL